MKRAVRHGILNIDKPPGCTSHDVVAQIRRCLGQREVGHAGTLDPLATGVLLVCAGDATRVAEYLMGGEKVYRATVRLGWRSNTYDADGELAPGAPVPSLTAEQLQASWQPFLGHILQQPPAFAAIKQGGVPAYRRARRGEEVDLPARPVVIRGIELVNLELPDFTIDVTCGPGTYIRSLAHDVGETIGCGGYLTALRRLRSGDFRVEDAATPEEIARDPDARLQPLRVALAGWTVFDVDPGEETKLRQGQSLQRSGDQFPDGSRAYARGANGAVVAILVYDAGRERWQPKKVFESVSASLDS